MNWSVKHIPCNDMNNGCQANLAFDFVQIVYISVIFEAKKYFT